jgi:hypothetical protein
VLKELGFIDFKTGAGAQVQHILIFNPYFVVKALKAKGWVQENTYAALFERAMAIGANDLDDEVEI